MNEIKRYRCCGPSDDMFGMYQSEQGPFVDYLDHLADVEQREKAHAAEVERLRAEVSALTQALDHATSKKMGLKAGRYGPFQYQEVTGDKFDYMRRDYLRLTQDDIALCERLEKEVWGKK